MMETPERILQVIFNLAKNGEAVKSIELSKILGINRSDVFRSLKALKIFGYIQQEPYGKIMLTDKGKSKAKQMILLHKGLTTLLSSEIELPQDEAENLSYKIEHLLSESAINKIVEALKKNNLL